MRAGLRAWCLLAACVCLQAQATVWQPSAGHAQTPIWPGSPPDPQQLPGPEYAVTDEKSLIAGKPVTGIYNVSHPTMTVYAPNGRNTGAAVVVFPGGGFELLAIDLEGTEVCEWLKSIGGKCNLRRASLTLSASG